MGTYRPLYSLRVEHDYYDNLACRALAFRLKAGGVDLCRRRGLLFRQTAVNEWTLLYDCDSAGVDTSSDKVEAELCITDPAFVLFTDWAALRPENAYTLELPASRDTVEATEAIRESADRRRIGSGFCSVSILMTEKILAAAQKEKHKTCTLRFHAPQCKWEYLLVPDGVHAVQDIQSIRAGSASHRFTGGCPHEGTLCLQAQGVLVCNRKRTQAGIAQVRPATGTGQVPGCGTGPAQAGLLSLIN